MNRPKQIIRIVAFGMLLGAMASAVAQTAPDLEVSDPRWESSNAIHTSRYNAPVDRGQAANYLPSSEASALFRNTGQKVIKSVSWTYIFYQDEAHKTVLTSHTFHSRKRIAPGSEVRLKASVFSTIEPREWTNYHAVVVSRIGYTDGTVWQAEIKRK